MAKSKIDWTEENWEVTGGCTKCSEGCRNCYAIPLIHRFSKNSVHKGRYDGLVKDGNWTGKVELFGDRIDQPLERKKPTIYFVNSRSDLFHPKVDIGFLTHVFDTIEQCPQHTFQILIKRPDQALKMMWGKHGEGWRYFGKGDYHPNIHFGVSICTPEEKDKIDILCRIPAAVRYISFEPLLADMGDIGLTDIDWVIIGCESLGRMAGRFKEVVRWPQLMGDDKYEQMYSIEACNRWIEAAIRIVEQCKAAGVPVFVKQIPYKGKVIRKEGEEWPDCWPEQLRCQEKL